MLDACDEACCLLWDEGKDSQVLIDVGLVTDRAGNGVVFQRAEGLGKFLRNDRHPISERQQDDDVLSSTSGFFYYRVSIIE